MGQHYSIEQHDGTAEPASRASRAVESDEDRTEQPDKTLSSLLSSFSLVLGYVHGRAGDVASRAG